MAVAQGIIMNVLDIGGGFPGDDNHFFQQLNDYDERKYCFSLPVSLDLMLQRFRGARDGPKGSLVFCCES